MPWLLVLPKVRLILEGWQYIDCTGSQWDKPCSCGTLHQIENKNRFCYISGLDCQKWWHHTYWSNYVPFRSGLAPKMASYSLSIWSPGRYRNSSRHTVTWYVPCARLRRVTSWVVQAARMGRLQYGELVLLERLGVPFTIIWFNFNPSLDK